jgi:hypothetical protein
MEIKLRIVGDSAPVGISDIQAPGVSTELYLSVPQRALNHDGRWLREQ